MSAVDDAAREPTAATTANDRRIAFAVIAAAIAIAVFTGFRMPNAWSATLQSVSLIDGFHRRFVVGTLLYPLTSLTGHDYRVHAGFSFLVAAAVIAVLARLAWRADRVGRLWIVAWLVLPTGGFLFNEVGYFEQVLYLLLFAAIWLVHRGRLTAAAAVMSIAPMVHEMALLTVIPVFGVVVLREVPFRRALIATLIPAAINGALLALPAESSSSIQQLSTALSTASFRYRPDALVLFEHSAHPGGGVRSVPGNLRYVGLPAILLAAAFAALWLSDRRGWPGPRDRQRPSILVAASCAAIALPCLLSFGGWDGNRWLFLVISNFYIAVWLFLDGRPDRAPGPRAIAALVLAGLYLGHLSPWYFDRLEPRELGYREAKQFMKQLIRGSLFERTGDD